MESLSRFRHHYGGLFLVGAACALAGFAAGACSGAKDQMLVVPVQDARFVPVDPAQPNGAQLAVLWGDPSRGPSAMLLKLKKGGGQLHFHSSNYHLMMLQGTMKHWADGESQTEAKPLDPGSYWFQPGKQAHGDDCLTDECLMFVKWEGKRDGQLAEAGK